MLDRRLWREARAARLYLALTVGPGLGAGLLAVLQAGVLARVVSLVFPGGQGLAAVRPWLQVMLGLILLRALLAWASEAAARRAAAIVKQDLRRRLLDHLLALGPAYVRGERTGELVNVLVEGVESLEDYFAHYLPQLALAALLPLMILGFVLPLDLTTGLILLFTAPLIPLFMILIGKWAERLSRQQWEALSRMSAHFLDVLQGLTTLKLFGRSKSQAAVIARVSDRFRETTLGVLRVAFLSALMLELLATISTALVAVALGLRLVYARIPFERAFFLLLLTPEFYLPLRQLGARFHAGLAGVSAADRIFEILTLPVPGVPDRVVEKTDPPVPAELHISFDGVHYAYEGGTRPALNGASFDLRPGERVALAGASGAGKTTVARLLLRFMEPDRGEIVINGIPLRQIPAELWRRQVAYVPQHPHLFYGTIAENIRLGRPGATREEVMAAAGLAGAGEFIRRLPKGYDTPVGEEGIRLSGGQARLLAIARAFLIDARLLILDEPTAGLDAGSGQVLEDALARLMHGRTVLLIAHRPAAIRGADRIVVLADGRVAEEGRHVELMAKQGVYYRLMTALRGAA
ncbi:thiol reductant ABC exporter subunit CydD [Desulfotomaculum copahuensis]|uniref:Thiol reductant ABC exporter subunit CydD n=1 Tax=Desulfotomaculum copahuensis TaxID=1838280 RepID=A0A1B7LAT3_9FIRM|nr:thiol reductant ABC exporter subunit CydD [Desulfotomaculum copahuensis]OAT79423.1 thiol reductant ABC exporter subunit CydD [Desulfotomaculum copahuensis]